MHEKKMGSFDLPWKNVSSTISTAPTQKLLNNFLNNLLMFLEKVNSTIVSER